MQRGWGHKQVLSGLKSIQSELPSTATHCQTLSLSVRYNKSKLSSDWDESVWGFIMQFSHLGGCKAIDTLKFTHKYKKKNAMSIGVSFA